MTLEGIDVSIYQGAINWPTVASSGRRVAFIKATDGTTSVDPRFGENWPAAKDAGLFRAPYHYAHPGRDALTQAVHFFSQVGALGPGDLGPALDLEQSDGQSADAVLNWAVAFLDKVEVLFGRQAIVYTGGFWKYQLGNPASSPVATRPLWLAQYASTATVPAAWEAWSFWQYSGSGTVPGISAPCDLDRFAGTEDDLRRLAQAPLVTPPTTTPPWTRYFVWPATPMISGPDVAAWQAKVTARGFPLDVDGLYGPASKRTCVALQRSLGLNVDGIVGPKTWAATFGL